MAQTTENSGTNQTSLSIDAEREIRQVCRQHFTLIPRTPVVTVGLLSVPGATLQFWARTVYVSYAHNCRTHWLSATVATPVEAYIAAADMLEKCLYRAEINQFAFAALRIGSAGA